MSKLSRATNQVVQEFLSRTIDSFGDALLDGQHIEFYAGQWYLFDRDHKKIDKQTNLSKLLRNNYSYNTVRMVK